MLGYDSKILPLEYEKPHIDGFVDNRSEISSSVNSLPHEEESDDEIDYKRASTKSSRFLRQRDELRESIINDVFEKIMPDIKGYKFDDDAAKKQKVRYERFTKLLKYFACIELDLHDAVLSGNLYHVRKSVRKITQGTHPQPELLNQFDQTGCTPLSLATKINHGSIVLFLLESGASPDYIDEGTGRTPLFYSILNKNYEISNFLLSAGANADTVDFQCISPLMIAAAQNDVQHCTTLCQCNVDLDVQDEHGWTALHHAAANNAPDAIFFLLEEGANRDFRDRNKRKAVHIAKFKKHGECEYQLNSKPRTIVK